MIGLALVLALAMARPRRGRPRRLARRHWSRNSGDHNSDSSTIRALQTFSSRQRALAAAVNGTYVITALIQAPSLPRELDLIVPDANQPPVSVLYPRYCCTCRRKRKL